MTPDPAPRPDDAPARNRAHARTLTRPVTVEGRGLFTGRRATVEIAPAAPGSGLAFELPGTRARIPATTAAVTAEPPHPALAMIGPRNTSLAAPDGPALHTVEHLLAALTGLGVTDALCRVSPEADGPVEIPIGDGSAIAFVEALRDAGPADHADATPRATIAEPIEARSPDGRAWVRVEPADPAAPPTYRYELDYGPDAPLRPAAAEWHGDPDAFAAEVAPARTYSFAREAQAAAAVGLFAGFTPADLLVLDDATAEPIDNTLRFADEPARHKLLDLIGDLALVGRPFAARVTAHRSGHALNREAAAAIAAAIA